MWQTTGKRVQHNRKLVDFYHAARTTEERAAVQGAWMSGNTRILAATVAFGMGIDKPDVRWVFHHSMSKSLEGTTLASPRPCRNRIDLAVHNTVISSHVTASGHVTESRSSPRIIFRKTDSLEVPCKAGDTLVHALFEHGLLHVQGTIRSLAELAVMGSCLTSCCTSLLGM